jgi:hypothetical protein
MPHTAFARTRHLPAIGLTAGCAAALMLPEVAAKTVEPDPGAEITRLRAQGPSVLPVLFARYDKLDPGREKNELAFTIDKVAAQRYATVSRLYWYTDLAEAEAAAKTSQRPILALRMLGRLDEDLSCANSRLFRTVLYANTDVSRLLRDHFILYWSAERPVPRVTIDMGDGRKLERTTTGNSAHYVLDANGNVLDVLPGLYAPALFKEELTKSLALAKQVRGMDAKKRTTAVTAFHRAAMEKRAGAYQTMRAVSGWSRRGDRSFLPSLARAQRATMSKAVMEVRDLDQFGFDAGQISRDDIEQWATIAARSFGLKANPNWRGGVTPMFDLFDQRSLTLIKWLHDYGQPASPEPVLAGMIARLEYSVMADSALDELQLRQQIRTKLVSEPGLSFDALNTWIYAEVFHTPKSDPWLGLVPRTDFTGLPGDGVTAR